MTFLIPRGEGGEEGYQGPDNQPPPLPNADASEADVPLKRQTKPHALSGRHTPPLGLQHKLIHCLCSSNINNVARKQLCGLSTTSTLFFW